MVPQDVTEGVVARIGGGTDPRIVVAGCGGAGGRVVGQVYEKDLHGVETVAVNTDPGALERARADVRILLAKDVAVDGDPRLAGFAAEASLDLLHSALSGDIVFLVGGLGGGTGTGVLPVMASAARDAGAHTVGITIMPFDVEGRTDRANEGLASMKEHCDSVVVLDNNCLEKLGEDLSLRDAFAFMDQVVLTIIEGVMEHVNSSVMSTVMEEVETVAREMQSLPQALPVEVATPVIEAAGEYEPVAFDDTGFIGLR